MLVRCTGLHDLVMRTTQLSTHLVLQMQNRWLPICLVDESLCSSGNVSNGLHNPDVLASFVLDRERLSPSEFVFSQDQHKLRCLLTKECPVNSHNVIHVILCSCQALVISSASSPSYASLPPSSARCVRHSVRFLLLHCRLNGKRCGKCPGAFHCCLVFLTCMMRRRLCRCSFMGRLCSWHHTGWSHPRLQPRTYSRTRCQRDSDTRIRSSNGPMPDRDQKRLGVATKEVVR